MRVFGTNWTLLVVLLCVALLLALGGLLFEFLSGPTVAG
jgi:hypothetical protein